MLLSVVLRRLPVTPISKHLTNPCTYRRPIWPLGAAMPLYWVVLVVMLSTSFLFNSDQAAQDRIQSAADVSAVSISMLVYRNAVANYVSSNPGFSGVVADGSLNLPSWYVKPQGLGNYVVSGQSYTYYTEFIPGLAGELARRTESINVGTNRNGVLQSPNIANTGIVLPAPIPIGSVVLVQ